MKAIVDGIERHMVLRRPNCIQCDSCKVTIVPRNDLWKSTSQLSSLQVAAIADSGWSCDEDGDYCKECTEQ